MSFNSSTFNIYLKDALLVARVAEEGSFRSSEAVNNRRVEIETSNSQSQLTFC